MEKLLMSLMWYLIINSSMAMHHGCPTPTINAEPRYVTAHLPYFPGESASGTSPLADSPKS